MITLSHRDIPPEGWNRHTHIHTEWSLTLFLLGMRWCLLSLVVQSFILELFIACQRSNACHVIQDWSSSLLRLSLDASCIISLRWCCWNLSVGGGKKYIDNSSRGVPNCYVDISSNLLLFKVRNNRLKKGSAVDGNSTGRAVEGGQGAMAPQCLYPASEV